MKKVSLFALFASMLLAMSPSFAGSDNKNFDVTVNLTSVCTMTAPTAISVTYTSFTTGVPSAAGDGGVFDVKCTKNLPYSIGFDATATPAATKAVAAAAANHQLAYALSLQSSSSTGTGTTQANRVIVTVGDNQSGDYTAVGAPETHTVYVAY